MATLPRSGSRKLYSWWWDSHNSPKNSKWLQENLKDMDVKVKAMIKLIEEDADSFARRAEMYYKKRPELMKLVEEIYRAYRALAERYDHATVELRQAHRTMEEAFQNHIPYDLIDELTPGPEESHSPEIPRPIRSFCEPYHSSTSTDGLEVRAESSESEIQNVKEMLIKLEAEKEAIFVKAEIEKISKEALSGIEAERDAISLKYNQSLERISTLEEEVKALDIIAGKSKIETQNLRLQLSSLETEKEDLLHQYKLCLEKISLMEAEISAMAKTESGIARFQNDVKQLNGELLKIARNLDCAEEKCSQLEESNQALRLEADDLIRKITMKDQELAQKRDALEKAKEEIRSLNGSIMSSNISIKSLENENFGLNEIKDKLEEEAFRKAEHSDALELEIHRLREEINGRYQAIKIQVEVGMKTIPKSELEGPRSNSKSLEEFYQLIKREKSTIISERDALVPQLEIVEPRLENLEKPFSNIEEKYTSMENENEAMLNELEELRSSIVAQNEEHASYTTISETKASPFENRIPMGRPEFEGLEIFIFQKFVEDLEGKIHSMFIEGKNLHEATTLSNKPIAELELENLELKGEVKKMADISIVKETKFLELNESVKKLIEELQEVKNSNDLLTREIVTGNNFVRKKVEELSQTRKELKDMRELNAKLYKEVEELKMERKGSILLRENLEIENLELCIIVHNLNDGITWLNEMNKNLKSEIGVLIKESLSSELHERKDGFEIWDDEASSVYFDLQISSVTKGLEHDVVPQTQHFSGRIREEMNDENTVLCNKEKEKETMADRGTYNVHGEVTERVKQMKEFISEEASDHEVTKNERMFGLVSKPRTRRLENGTLMKDIPLDQVSDFSSRRKNERESRDSNDQILRLWEIVEEKFSQYRTPNEMQNKFEEKRYSDSLSELQIEKELVIDMLERCSSIREGSLGGKRREILQRLASDAQKLTNIQSQVHDLKIRLEKKNWIKKGISIEHQKVCKQVNEIEETVTQLLTVNDQLTKLEGKNVDRNSVMEQARKGSEKIGRLHLEVQNIELRLIKLEEEKKRKWKARFSKNKTGIILRDFIYNSRRNREKQQKRKKKKKNCFCGCNRGSTDEE